MGDTEKRARELLAVPHSDAGWHGLANEIRMNSTFDIDHGLALAAIRAALTPPEGYVLVPVAPTADMLQAAAFGVAGKSGQKFKPMMTAGYAAMLAARPAVLP